MVAMYKHMLNSGCRAALCLSMLVLVGGCGDKAGGVVEPGKAASAAGAGVRPGGAPVAVTTVLAKQRDFEVLLDAVGTVSALSVVDVKSQVSSVVAQVHAREGQYVRAGAVLFTLDARNDEANLAKAKAQLAKDAALLTDAQRQLARSKDLVSRGFVSQGAVDTAQAQVEAQQANVLADRAAVDSAQLAVSYATVRAAHAGRLGALNVYVGTAVVANQSVMVTLTQMEPVNVNFNLPQRYLGAALAGLQNGGAVVVARLQDEGITARGRLQFVDSVVDGATGTVKAKARFDNKDGRLWPGAFARVQMVADVLQDAVVVPVAAVVQSAKGPIVYVADKGKAILRPVKVLATQDGEAVVVGVNADERVVLEGRSNLRPDSAVVERAAVAAVGASATASKAASAP